MRRLGLTPSLVLGVLALAAWVALGLLAPVGSGAVHLLLAAGILLLVRRVVTGPDAW